MRHHKRDARRGFRLGRIECRDPPARDAAVNQSGVFETLERDLCCKARLTFDLQPAIDARHRLSDQAMLLHRRIGRASGKPTLWRRADGGLDGLLENAHGDSPAKSLSTA